MDNEQYYDEVIAPKLMDIANICKEKGIPFLAFTEYEHGKTGETRVSVPGQCLSMTMVQHCAKTAPNIDGYVFGLMKYAKENNIDTKGSMVINRLLSPH